MKSNLMTIIKKELSRFFTDRKLFLSTVILPGVMIYVIYTLMGTMLGGLFTTGDDYVYKIRAVNLPASIGAMLDDTDFVCNSIPLGELDQAKEALTDGSLDLCMVFPNNFDEAVADYDSQSGTAAPEVRMYYDSGKTASMECFQVVSSLLNAYESSFTNKFDINVSEDTYDFAEEGKDLLSRMMSAIVPMLFLTLLFSGCCSIAPDFIAGEKERGTIATLLVTPMKRSSLALGKIISMSIMTLLSGISSFLGVALSLPKLMNMDSETEQIFDFSNLGAPEYGMLLLLVFSVVLVLISLMSLISAQAKSVKECSTLLGPMNIIIMVIGLAGGYMGVADTNLATNLVPVYNFAKNMSLVMSGTATGAGLAVTVVSNLVYTVLCTWLLTRMFNSERVMFSN